MKAFQTLAVLSLALACSAVALYADDAPPASQPSPVDYQKMKDAMPDTLIGLKRNELRGNRMKFGHSMTSDAKADYGGEDGKPTVHIEALSYDNADKMEQMMGAWSVTKIDNTDEDGFQKTMKIDGHPGMVVYQTKDKHASITFGIGERILLYAEVENVTADQLKAIEDALPLKALDEAAK